MNVTAPRLSNQNSARRGISSDCISVESSGGTSPSGYLLSGSVIVVPPFADAEKARERFAGGGRHRAWLGSCSHRCSDQGKNSGNCFEDDPELPCAGRPMSGTVALSTVPAPQASGP